MPKPLRKTTRVPRTRAGGEWTEAAFWQFIRNNVRKMSQRWPPLVRIALQQARKPYQGPNKRRKWVYQCADCQQWFPRTEVQVDHIEPCGTLKSFDDLGPFVERLLCEADKLRVLCCECHQARKD